MPFSRAFQQQMQQHLDGLVGDAVVLKLHTGDPGADLNDNLAFGDGLPQRYSFRQGGTAVFTMPSMPPAFDRVPLPRKWWQLRRRYEDVRRPSFAYVHAVSMWANSGAAMRVHLSQPTPILLTPKSTLHITPDGKPTIT